MRICCTSELEEVVVVSEVAYTRSRHALSVTPRAGRPQIGRLEQTAISPLGA
jgi:hypothetical protein